MFAKLKSFVTFDQQPQQRRRSNLNDRLKARRSRLVAKCDDHVLDIHEPQFEEVAPQSRTEFLDELGADFRQPATPTVVDGMTANTGFLDFNVFHGFGLKYHLCLYREALLTAELRAEEEHRRRSEMEDAYDMLELEAMKMKITHEVVYNANEEEFSGYKFHFAMPTPVGHISTSMDSQYNYNLGISAVLPAPFFNYVMTSIRHSSSANNEDPSLIVSFQNGDSTAVRSATIYSNGVMLMNYGTVILPRVRAAVQLLHVERQGTGFGFGMNYVGDYSQLGFSTSHNGTKATFSKKLTDTSIVGMNYELVPNQQTGQIMPLLTLGYAMKGLPYVSKLTPQYTSMAGRINSDGVVAGTLTRNINPYMLGGINASMDQINNRFSVGIQLKLYN